MVRRIGFGNTKLPEDIGQEPDTSSVESAYARLKADTEATPQFQSLGARIFGVLFLGVWLIGWTGGIGFATFALFSSDTGFSKVFLFIWLSAAVIGWWFAVRTLIRLLKGKKP
jgi:hypothetical protein